MKQFALAVFVFFLPLALAAIVFFQADGHTDPFYLRFTTPKQSSLVIGTSRAAQGVMPSVLNKYLNRSDIYNYSFTIAHSPFGPVYYESIKRKLNSKGREGVFIVTVDPWSVSSNTDPLDSSLFFENDLALAKTKLVNLSPNIQYLLTCYDEPYINLFRKKKPTGLLLHNDGWLEVTTTMDSVSVLKRLQEKLKEYKENHLRVYKFSEIRWKYLIKTLELLKKHGSVYLVRLPVHCELYEIDALLLPDFDDKLQKLSTDTQVPYLNLTSQNERHVYVDGNHLHKASSANVSMEIAKWVKTIKNEYE